MDSLSLEYIAAGFGAASCVIGAGLSIAKIGSHALDGIARQPDAAGKIQTSMIIAAALIEGVSLFGLVICFMLVIK
jgi:F-type H+-transporting ATPase subunit c